mmetsp:Transcript_40954/g.115999  ORF Transcript_40954/g.115999 Transcript_40954/m.115999 type:complete len:136 (-) Transcript_40954:162-569(-)
MRTLACLLSVALLSHTATALAPALETAEGSKPHKKKLAGFEKTEDDFKNEKAQKWAEWAKAWGIPETKSKDGPGFGEKILETLSGMKPVVGAPAPKAPTGGEASAPTTPNPADSIDKAMEQFKEIGKLFLPPASK